MREKLLSQSNDGPALKHRGSNMGNNNNLRKLSDIEPGRERLLSDNQRKNTSRTKRTGSHKRSKRSERSLSELSIESAGAQERRLGKIKPEYRDIPLKEMMRYYEP